MIDEQSQHVDVVRYVERSDATVDMLSFDPGTRNCGVVHVRVDRQTCQCCILHAALLDLLNPAVSLSLAAARRAAAATETERRRKPGTVEPFHFSWPRTDVLQAFFWTEQHRAALQKAQHLEERQESNFAELIALVPHTLHAVDWLSGNDTLSQVLIEVQDPQNAKMRSLAHAIQTYYETHNMLQRSLTVPLEIHFVSSRLKLSDADLQALDSALRFVPDPLVSEAMGANVVDLTQPHSAKDVVIVGTTDDNDSLTAVVDRQNHGKRKTSAKLIFDALVRRYSSRPPFLQWVERQRSTKHNVLDALLQCWSWCLDQGVGFDSALLRDTRKQRQRNNAAARRKAQKRSAASTTPPAEVSVSPQRGEPRAELPTIQPAPKRRRVTLSRAVVQVELD